MELKVEKRHERDLVIAVKDTGVIICFADFANTDLPTDQVKQLMEMMCHRYNGGEDDAWERLVRENERLKTENGIMREWAKKHNYIAQDIVDRK